MKVSADKKIKDLEKKDRDMTVEGEALKKENANLHKLVNKLRVNLSHLELVVDQGKKEVVSVGSRLGQETTEKVRLEGEVSALKAEVERGVEDVAEGLEEGYRQCFDRVVVAGINMSGHTFEAYCEDLAKRMVATEASTETTEGGAV